MKNNKTAEKQPDEPGTDISDPAVSLYARGYAESAEGRRRTDVDEAQGKALFQIKEFAQAGFMAVPEATEEAFHHLWRKAFLIEASLFGQWRRNTVRIKSARDD